MKLSRWNEALNSFQQLLTADPAYQKDKALLRLVRDCKKQLGYELSPAERKAGRRLWPFGVWHLYRGLKRVDQARVMALGVRPEYRHSGIDALMYLELLSRGQRLGYRRGREAMPELNAIRFNGEGIRDEAVAAYR